jgi:ABC-type multidrug transport system fused ATPase/permease subunit
MPAEKRLRLSFGALRFFRDRVGVLTLLGVLSLVSAVFQALALMLIVPLADAIANKSHEWQGHIAGVHFVVGTEMLALLAAGAIIAAAIFDITISWVRARVMTDWDYENREAVVDEYLHADYPTQAGERLGTLGLLTTYVTRGSGALGAIANGEEAILTIFIFLVGAMLINFRFALLIVLTLAGLSLALRPLIKRTRKYSQALSKMLIDYSREVTEATRMVRDARVFHAGDALGVHLTKISKRFNRVRRRATFVNGASSPVYQYIGMLVVVIALAVVAGLQTLNLTEFGSIALLMLRSMSFGQQLQTSYAGFVDVAPYLERLETVRVEYRENRTADGHIPLESVHGLDLDHVGFSYDGKVPALVDVSASFRPGEIVGIVGPSGSGKSTLSQLILRLRQPTTGRVVVNGTDAREYTLASWYQHVSLVPQDPRLLHATVAENIAFLDARIDGPQVVAAAKAAGVHEVIESLDSGYETMIGPAFRDLSGGQIQRIGIARALARNAQVLVLDEPTSALDVHSEQVIQATLESLRGRVLTMIIAHRLSTLSICDRILVLQAGAVETIGTLAEVSERSAFFRRALDAGTLEIGVGTATPPVAAPDEV